MLSYAAKIFGLGMLLIGATGFFLVNASGGHFFGLIQLKAGYSILYLCTGVSAILSAHTNARTSKAFFLLTGIVYGLIAFFGFVHADQSPSPVMAYQVGDAWLHMAVAAVSVCCGSMAESRRSGEMGLQRS